MLTYLIQNEINGKVYVGKSIKPIVTRWNQHCNKAKSGVGHAIHRAMRKYGIGNFSLLEACPANGKEELNELEKFLICIFNYTDRDFGYNLTIGGDGVPMTPEMSRAIGLKLRGRKNPKHSEFMKGRTPWNKGKKTGHNPKHAKAMRGKRAWNKGTDMGEDFRNKCREREAKKHPKQFKLKLEKQERTLEQVLVMRESGMKYEKIAQHFGVTRAAISRQLIDGGFKKQLQLPHNEIVTMRNEGKSLRSIARRFGVSRQSISRRLRAVGE